MDKTDAMLLSGKISSSSGARQKGTGEETKRMTTNYPTQESISVMESGVALGLPSYGGSDSGLYLRSGSQNDYQHYSKTASNMGSNMGDSGFASNSGSSSLSSEQSLSHSLQASCSIASPVEDTENYYKMNHPKRGHCLIINNMKFDKKTCMDERKGSEIDAGNVYHLFGKLGFEVDLQHNQTTVQMLQHVFRIASLNHKDCDCLVMVLLSHGDDGIIYGTNGFMRFEDLFAPLKGNDCKSLVGKPKLFFIQACRGTILDEGVDVADAIPDSNEKQKKEEEKRSRIPVEADFLYAYSSPAGHYSFRNNAKGSWFIQGLCKVFEEHAKDKEIMQILTRVNRYVAVEFESRSKRKEHSGKKQIPSIVSMLTKELYFRMK